jgi:hypothetical protein
VGIAKKAVSICEASFRWQQQQQQQQPAASSQQQPAAASITSEFQVPILALSVDRSQESMMLPSNTTTSPAGMRNVLLFRRIIHLSVTHGRNPSIKASRASQAKQAKPSNPPIATFMRE